MIKSIRALRANVICLVSVSTAAACMLAPQVASAQAPIPLFIQQQNLSETNLGRSAVAIQRTCKELIDTGFTTGGHELWRRCNELVATANSINTGVQGGRTLGYTGEDDLNAALQQVNGEEALAQSTFAQNASYEQFSNIAARLGALRGATSASVTSVAATGTEFMYGSGGGAAADDMPFGPWGWFVRGTSTTGDRDPSDPASFSGAENGFKFDQYGVTVGIDHMTGSRIWGVAVTYTEYDLDIERIGGSGASATTAVDGGSVESDSISASFYYDFTNDDNIYFSALTGYGQQSFDLARSFTYFPTVQNTAADVVVQNRAIVGAPDGDSLAATLSVGRVMQAGAWVIDPHFALTYDRVIIDRYTERDSGNENSQALQQQAAMQLAFDEQEIESFRANLGVQLSRNFNTSFGSIRPTFSLDWHHEFEDKPRQLKVKYALEDALVGAPATVPGETNDFRTGFDGCASCFTLESDAPDSDFFVVGTGLAASFANGLQAFAMLEGLLNYDDLNTYALTIGLRGQF